MYIPPVESPYYRDAEIINGISMLKDCIRDIVRMYGSYPLITHGDFNAGTASENASLDAEPMKSYSYVKTRYINYSLQGNNLYSKASHGRGQTHYGKCAV